MSNLQPYYYDFMIKYSEKFDLENHKLSDFLNQKLSYEWIWLVSKLIDVLNDKNEKSFFDCLKQGNFDFKNDNNDIKNCIKQNINFLKTANIVGLDSENNIYIKHNDVFQTLLKLNNCFDFVVSYCKNYLCQLKIYNLVVDTIKEDPNTVYRKFVPNNKNKNKLNEIFIDAIKNKNNNYKSKDNLIRIFNKPCKYIWYALKSPDKLNNLPYSQNIIDNYEKINNYLYSQQSKNIIKESNNKLDEMQDDEYNLMLNDFIIDDPLIKKWEKRETIYGRNLNTSLMALKNAGYLCEIDNKHLVFKRKNNPRINYTEGHHLIPISAQKYFKNSIDIIENIVSLCVLCHKEIHQGENYKKLIEIIYKKRKDLLKKRGLKITLNKLIEYYN